MDRDELVERYFEAWNQKNTPGLLKLMHPQASYYDAFWQESCSGKHLATYFVSSFELDDRWYRPRGESIPTPNGVIARYEVFDRDDTLGLTPILNGAEVFTISDGLIMTVSDYYCDPTQADLMEVATLAEGQHGRANVIQHGLGAQAVAGIMKRLTELAAGSTEILDPSLTVTRLADHIGCTVLHLFHVLEDVQNTTFSDYVNACRATHASTLIIDAADGDIDIDLMATQCGFESAKELDAAFQSTFDQSVDEYVKNFAKS